MGVMLWGLGGYVAVWAAPDSLWAYEWRYSLDTDMQGAVLAVAPKPHDCEFLTAPIDAKHCHYDRHVTTTRVRTSGGLREASTDDGRTWLPDDGSTQPAVWVSWVKVHD